MLCGALKQRRLPLIATALVKKPLLDPQCADLAPTDPVLTTCEEHTVTHMRMLDADAEGADWHEVSRVVLHIDPEREPDRARRAFDSHLARAKWAVKIGYRFGVERHANSETLLPRGSSAALRDPPFPAALLARRRKYPAAGLGWLFHGLMARAVASLTLFPNRSFASHHTIPHVPLCGVARLS